MKIDDRTFKLLEQYTGVSWRQFIIHLLNVPCADALDLLWQEIVLTQRPDYGDWEYPGQAYRHLLAEFKEKEQKIMELRREKAILMQVVGEIANYEDYEDMEESAADIGLTLEEHLKFAYENIQSLALNATLDKRINNE